MQSLSTPCRIALLCLGANLVTGCSLDTVTNDEDHQVIQLVEAEVSLHGREVRSAWSLPREIRLIGHHTFPLPSMFFTCQADSTGDFSRNALGLARDVTLTYPSDRCSQSIGGVNISTVGSIRVQDLGGPWSVRVTYQGMLSVLASTQGRTENTLDGWIELHTADDTTLQVTRQLMGSSTTGANAVRRINAVTTEVVDPRGVVPASSDGRFLSPTRMRWTGAITAVYLASSDSIQLALSTVTPLVPNAGCLSGYSAGEVRVLVTGTRSADLRVRFSC